MLNVSIQKKLSNFILDVSFQARNETVVLFGPSGSGKTTILNIIAGLTSPDNGEITLDGRALYKNKKVNVPIQHRKTGYVFQDYALFPHMKVQKNILFGTEDTKLAEELMYSLKISHLSLKYPHEISGGEKQRVALARCLAAQPSVLLLDEPFSSLDEQTKEDSHHALLTVTSSWNIPVILVTHDKQEAEKLGDRILPIHNGRLGV
ncbi:ATP-binding cassette domain-containing protein [Halobacillus sp. Marseille-Q1614]|uniref:ATP-binding cassette domain-containing protein n=1 Tax=Halobacillus sp. Marseille-Q1614 TaxID=2709134 RepID=UPI00156F29B0|nr:ATP-binding cassette domain-containing protein [Halobacillus sp. Marseille-Q1614]